MIIIKYSNFKSCYTYCAGKGDRPMGCRWCRCIECCRMLSFWFIAVLFIFPRQTFRPSRFCRILQATYVWVRMWAWRAWRRATPTRRWVGCYGTTQCSRDQGSSFGVLQTPCQADTPALRPVQEGDTQRRGTSKFKVRIKLVLFENREMFNEGPIISLTKSNRIFTMYSNCRPTGGCAVFFHGLRHPWWRSVSGLSLSVYRIPWYIFLAEGQCSHDDRSHKSVQGHPKGWFLPNTQTYPKTRKHSSRMRTAAFLVPVGGGGGRVCPPCRFRG